MQTNGQMDPTFAARLERAMNDIGNLCNVEIPQLITQAGEQVAYASIAKTGSLQKLVLIKNLVTAQALAYEVMTQLTEVERRLYALESDAMEQRNPLQY